MAYIATESEKSSQTTKDRMNLGYYLEEELILRDSSYASYYGHVPGYGLLKNEYEGEPKEPIIQEWDLKQNKENDKEDTKKKKRHINPRKKTIYLWHTKASSGCQNWKMP